VTYFFALAGIISYTFTFLFEYIPITFVAAGVTGYVSFTQSPFVNKNAYILKCANVVPFIVFTVFS
jgi:hypothetical protein